MKTLTTLLFLFLTQTAFSAEMSTCKNEALKAAYERFTFEYPESIISVKTMGKPVLDGKEVYHSIQVTDMESNQKIVMGVILEKNSCKVIAVN